MKRREGGRGRERGRGRVFVSGVQLVPVALAAGRDSVENNPWGGVRRGVSGSTGRERADPVATPPNGSTTQPGDFESSRVIVSSVGPML